MSSSPVSSRPMSSIPWGSTPTTTPNGAPNPAGKATPASSTSTATQQGQSSFQSGKKAAVAGLGQYSFAAQPGTSSGKSQLLTPKQVGPYTQVAKNVPLIKDSQGHFFFLIQPQFDEDGNLTGFSFAFKGSSDQGSAKSGAAGKADPNFKPSGDPKNPANIAAQFAGPAGEPGMGIQEVKQKMGGSIDASVDPSECCANFVSACLEQAGLISPGERSNNVSQLGANLAATGRFHQVSLQDCKPGDVVLMGTPAHAKMVYSNDGKGNVQLIGSDNNAPDGTQTITISPYFGEGNTIWEPNNPVG